MPADTSPPYHPHRRDAGYGVDCRCGAKSGIVRRDGESWGDHCPVAMREEIARLKAELAEALATLANERGEGEPPVEGWVWTDCAGWGWAWVFGGGPDEWIAVHHKPGAGWYVRLGSAFMWMHAQVAISYATARAAIRDASAAKGGAR